MTSDNICHIKSSGQLRQHCWYCWSGHNHPASTTLNPDAALSRIRKASRPLAIRQRSPPARARPAQRNRTADPNQRRLQRYALRHPNDRQRTLDLERKPPLPPTPPPRTTAGNTKTTRANTLRSTRQKRRSDQKQNPTPSPRTPHAGAAQR
jgi:hypothetical protein